MSDTENRNALVHPNGGDLLVALMEALDVDTAFGVVSVHNMPLVDAVSRELRFVPVRHEAAAVNAADAYARVSGKVGIALTSTGTGAGNAAGSMIEALSAGARVLHLTGQIETPHLGLGKGFIHETKDQAAMLEAVSKAAFSVTSTDDAAEVLRLAVEAILTAPSGPASVEWPIDLQYAVHEIKPFELHGRPTEAPQAEALDRAAALIASAKRPLLWLGGGAVGCRSEIEQLVDLTRAGVLTSNSGRGVLDEGDGSCIGNFTTSPVVRALLAEADLLVSVGTHFRSNETGDYDLVLPDQIVQIDVDATAIGRTYPATAGVVGDAGEVIEALCERLPDRTDTDPDWTTQVSATRRLAREALSDGIGWQASICDAVRTALPRRSVIARDVTIPSSTWGNRLLAMNDSSVNVFPHGGGIGQGLAMGIGAAVARPEVPTLALIGDGGLAVHLGELATMAQEQPWLVVLLYNDGGYGVLRNTQDVFVGERSGVDLATPDFSLLARAYGMHHVRVGSLDDIEEALAAAIGVRGPAIVEVDVDAFGPMPRPFTPPVKIPGAV